MRCVDRASCRLAGLLLLGLLVLVTLLPGPAGAIPPPARFRVPGGRDYAAWKDVPTVTVAVVALHSLSHDDREPIAQGWQASAARHDFLLVMPNGNGSWNAGRCCGPAATARRDDVGYLLAVLADVQVRWHPARVYLTGWSNGAMMVERLVAEHPETTRAFAVAGGAPEMPAPGDWPGGTGWVFHGKLDTTVPWNGGYRAWCACQIRPGWSLPRWVQGASLFAELDPARGHAVPPNWPEVAYQRLTMP